MSKANITDHTDAEREREAATARAELERRADTKGIKPFDADEWLTDVETGQTPEEIRQEVDDFLMMLREWRDTPSARSIN